MGVEGKPLAPGAEQGEALDLVTQEIQDRGFIVANFEKLAGWARSGSPNWLSARSTLTRRWRTTLSAWRSSSASALS
ncbi:MAG: hypothetical protein ACPGSP_08515 [Alphaproteobacteria bacterium]